MKESLKRGSRALRRALRGAVEPEGEPYERQLSQKQGLKRGSRALRRALREAVEPEGEPYERQ